MSGQPQLYNLDGREDLEVRRTMESFILYSSITPEQTTDKDRMIR